MNRPPLVFRAWFRVLDVLGVRPHRHGDGRLRYVLTEPWDASTYYWGRFRCRVLRDCGPHNDSCRGRVGHRREVVRR